MKKIYQLLALATLIFCACSNKNKIVGEWKTEGENEKGSFIFNKDGTIVAIDEYGKTDDMGFKSKNIKYKTDFSKTPAHLDYVFFNDENEEVFRLRGIIELLSDNTIRIGFNTNKEGFMEVLSRPKSFTDADSRILRRR